MRKPLRVTGEAAVQIAVPEIKSTSVTLAALPVELHQPKLEPGLEPGTRPLTVEVADIYAPGTASEVVASPEIKMTAVGFSARK
jgi:hypothetical protein